jgi:bacterial/archaeal transporter family-2 protein
LTTTEIRRSRSAQQHKILGLSAAFIIGVLLQSRLNGELGSRLGDGLTAALISFGSGLSGDPQPPPYCGRLSRGQLVRMRAR